MSHPDPALHPGITTPAVSADPVEPAHNPRGAAFPAWLRPAADEASRMELPYDPVFVHSSLGGQALLTALHGLGAELQIDEARIGWHACQRGDWAGHELPAWMHREDPECEISNFAGVFRFTLDGRAWLAGQLPRPRGHVVLLESLLGGPSLAALLKLEGRLREVVAELQADRLQVFGSRLAHGDVPDVDESELILERGLKSAVLAFLDRFERELAHAAAEPRGWSRGLLMMGRPGTGKTLTIGHILGRLSHFRRYLFVPGAVRELDTPGRRFEDLIRHIGDEERPAVVVVEDIDRLFHAGTVTPQYFLNVLDGMLRPGAPTLWIATCNDPSDLPENLTDRPGRFDRILVFEDPGLEERIRLLRLYACTPLPDQTLAALAHDADGLTGAHIAEACRAADGGNGEDVGDAAAYAGRLASEIVVLRRQQGAAARYGRLLRGDTVGF